MQESSQLTDSPNTIFFPKLIYIVAISIDFDNKRDDERKEKNNDCQKKIKEKKNKSALIYKEKTG